MAESVRDIVDTEIDDKLADLIDLELAKSVKCTLDIDYGSYWVAEWADSKGEVIRCESFNGMTGHEIILPQLNVIIAERHILDQNYDDLVAYEGQKVMIVDLRLIENMLLTGKNKDDETKNSLITV